MPRVVPYPVVLERLAAVGATCVYPNGGAFALMPREIVGWIGPEDPTIRPGVACRIERVGTPYAEQLAARLTAAWRADYPGDAWVMPASHWAYELDFGSAAWLPAALRTAGFDPAALQPLTQAAALAFGPGDAGRFEAFMRALLDHLVASDFTVAFPDHAAVVTIHHHKQVWWQWLKSG